MLFAIEYIEFNATCRSYGYLGIIWFPQPNTKVQVHQRLQNRWCAPFQTNELNNNKYKLFTFKYQFGVRAKCNSMIGRDILLPKPIFWIPAFYSGTDYSSKFTIIGTPLEVIFYPNILKMECSILLHFYVDKRETHRLKLWINGFFISIEINFGKFYMGLRIVWVMKPIERERDAL